MFQFRPAQNTNVQLCVELYEGRRIVGIVVVIRRRLSVRREKIYSYQRNSNNETLDSIIDEAT
jgi:hypothetical protein